MIKSSFGLLLAAIITTGITIGITTGAAQTEQRPAVKSQENSPTIEQAETLLSAGKPDRAIEILSVIPKTKSNEARTNYLLGQAHYQKSDYVRAVEYLAISIKQAQQGSSQYQQVAQMLGMSHYFLSHIKEAIPYLEDAARFVPGNLELAYILGVSYIRTQNPDKSRGAFARMFSVPPDSASAYLINAQMLIRQQVEILAEKELQKALEIDPKLPQANFLLGEMAIYRAEVALGIELLRKEIALNPAFAMAYYRLGEAYTRQLKWDEAIAPLQKSIWLNPFFSGPYIVLGKTYLKKGELLNAEGMIRRALNMDPNNYSGHNLLAQLLQQSNRRQEAREEFELAERLRTKSDQ
ncbi:MAG: tetratricopeptide repeat protein [Pyrinomonadaceae bacterium]